MTKHRIWLPLAGIAASLWILGGTPVIAVEPAQALGVGKVGLVTLTEESRVGQLNLTPGAYFIQHRAAGNDHFLNFLQLTEEPPFGVKGGPSNAHPGEVKSRLEPLNRKVRETHVTFQAENGVRRITRIEIAGENVAYVIL